MVTPDFLIEITIKNTAIAENSGRGWSFQREASYGSPDVGDDARSASSFAWMAEITAIRVIGVLHHGRARISNPLIILGGQFALRVTCVDRPGSLDQHDPAFFLGERIVL